MNITIDQLEEILQENTYEYRGSLMKSRAFSGLYQNSTLLPPLALPGGDIGELAILYSAASTYGFDVDYDKALGILADLVGGLKEITFKDTITHPLEAYRHLYFLLEEPEKYNLDKTGVDMFEKQLGTLGIKLPSFENKHMENEDALILLSGDYGLLPQYEIRTAEQSAKIKMLLFHRTYVDKRHKVFAGHLVDNAVVKLYDGLDADYLYEVLSETTDIHLYETVSRINSNMPIFSASLTPSDKFVVEQYQ